MILITPKVSSSHMWYTFIVIYKSHVLIYNSCVVLWYVVSIALFWDAGGAISFWYAGRAALFWYAGWVAPFWYAGRTESFRYAGRAASICYVQVAPRRVGMCRSHPPRFSMFRLRPPCFGICRPSFQLVSCRQAIDTFLWPISFITICFINSLILQLIYLLSKFQRYKYYHILSLLPSGK